MATSIILKNLKYFAFGMCIKRSLLDYDYQAEYDFKFGVSGGVVYRNLQCFRQIDAGHFLKFVRVLVTFFSCAE